MKYKMLQCEGQVVKLSKNKLVDSTRIVVKLVVESVGRWVGMKEAYNGTSVS
jgi:hypothetical protein